MNRIKQTYICRDIKDYQVQYQVDPSYQPVAGDVALFEVLSIGKHKSIQGKEVRNVTILPGDVIMAAFGTRYATEQFEGYLPEDLFGELHILGAGGTVGVLASMHNKFSSVGPTTLRLVGLVTNNLGHQLNTKNLYGHEMLRFSGAAAANVHITLSVGSSMDSGKTTSAAYLVRGLSLTGKKVAFIKLTGTVFTKDADLATDLGAQISLDFSRFGFPSTYMCDEQELLDLYESLVSKANDNNVDHIVMEIADGLYQRETWMLLNSGKFMDTIDMVMFSACDSLAAINGVHLLDQLGHPASLVSGLLTASPLLTTETCRHTATPVFNIQQLSDPIMVENIFKPLSALMRV